MTIPTPKQSEPLSNWPGKAGLQMLEDVQRVRGLEGVRLDMSFWVDDQGTLCEVCAAGAVVLCRGGGAEGFVDGCPRDNRIKALDHLRSGQWYYYLKCFGVPHERASIICKTIADELGIRQIRVQFDSGRTLSPDWFKGIAQACESMDRELTDAGWSPEDEVDLS